MTADPLARLLAPAAIAVIGASNAPTKRGHQTIVRLLADGYRGKIYPVNPRESEILGLQTYARVADIAGRVDLALISTPAPTIPAILAECGDKGIAGAVVLALGFGEMGEAGRELESAIIDAAPAHVIRLIGPNTNGIFNLHKRMNLVGMDGVAPGAIAVASQSGNIMLGLADEDRATGGLGFSSYIGVGNQADLSFADCLGYFSEDPHTAVSLLYIEGIKQGPSLLEAARRASLAKPILAYKTGRTDAGRNSARSHTGALAGSYRMTVDVLRQAGIVMVENSMHLLAVAEVLARCPPPRGARVAVLADSGGHCTVAADAIVEAGLNLAQVSPATQALLGSELPPAAALDNPFDVAGATDDNPALFARYAAILLGDDNVDLLLMVGMIGGYGARFSATLGAVEMETVHALADLVRTHDKPIIAQSVYAPTPTAAITALRENGVPVFAFAETAVAGARALVDYARAHRRAVAGEAPPPPPYPDATAIIEHARAENRQALYEHEARELIRAYGVDVPQSLVLGAQSDIPNALARLGSGPHAMKIISRDILHKSDAGGVMLGIADRGQAVRAFTEIRDNARAYSPDADIYGVLLTPMAAPGIEVIVGLASDLEFGQVMMFGLGGVWVEAHKDVAFRTQPLDHAEVRSMIDQIAGRSLLDGFRGQPPVDIDALADVILSLAALAQIHCEDIAEIEINPLIARADGHTIADARIRLT